MVTVTVSIDSSPQLLLDTNCFVNLIVFTLTVLDEPHQVAMQMFLHRQFPEEERGEEAMSNQQTQAANKFQLTHVFQKGARKHNCVGK